MNQDDGATELKDVWERCGLKPRRRTVEAGHTDQGEDLLGEFFKLDAVNQGKATNAIE